MPTLNDVAKQANVSPATVSRVINNSQLVSAATRARVLEAIRSLGYEVSRSSASANGKLILVVSDVSNAESSAAMYRAIAEQGYQMISFYFCEGQSTQEDLLRFLQVMLPLQQIAGILLENVAVPLHDELCSLLELFPVVELGCRCELKRTINVGIDYFQAAYDATEYLISLGCRRIATFYSGGLTAGKRGDTRVSGYRSALMAHGIAPEPELLLECDILVEGGYDATEQILRTAAPDAILCPVDVMAVGAIRAASELGYRIPDALKVMSLSGDWYSPYTVPSLTSLVFPREALCKEAVQILCRLIAGEEMHSQNVFLPYTFELGESTEGVK